MSGFFQTYCVSSLIANENSTFWLPRSGPEGSWQQHWPLKDFVTFFSPWKQNVFSPVVVTLLTFATSAANLHGASPCFTHDEHALDVSWLLSSFMRALEIGSGLLRRE
jgi:hypothetical protein